MLSIYSAQALILYVVVWSIEEHFITEKEWWAKRGKSAI